MKIKLIILFALFSCGGPHPERPVKSLETGRIYEIYLHPLQKVGDTVIINDPWTDLIEEKDTCIVLAYPNEK